MLILILAAALAFETQPDATVQPPCPATHVRVSKILEPQPDRSDQRPVPRSKTKAKEPSVLLPSCKHEREPKKKSYPLA